MRGKAKVANRNFANSILICATIASRTSRDSNKVTRSCLSEMNAMPILDAHFIVKSQHLCKSLGLTGILWPGTDDSMVTRRVLELAVVNQAQSLRGRVRDTRSEESLGVDCGKGCCKAWRFWTYQYWCTLAHCFASTNRRLLWTRGIPVSSAAIWDARCSSELCPQNLEAVHRQLSMFIPESKSTLDSASALPPPRLSTSTW